MNAPTDEKLLKDFLGGNPASFELLVRRHSQELHQFVLRFTGDSVAAEDVVQDTLLQVHQAADQFDPTRRFKPWLFTIAANKARDYLRRRSRKREVSFEAQLQSESGSTKRFIDLLSGEASSPDTGLLQEEMRQIVKAVVGEMPEPLKEVLILAYFHRFPYKHISEIVGIPLGTVKSRLHTAVIWFADKYRSVMEQSKLDSQ